jgi:hypothetical protein
LIAVPAHYFSDEMTPHEDERMPQPGAGKILTFQVADRLGAKASIL